MKTVYVIICAAGLTYLTSCNSSHKTVTNKVIQRDTVSAHYDIKEKEVEKTVIIDTTTKRREVEVVK